MSNPSPSVLSNGPAKYHLPSRSGSPCDSSVARTVSDRVPFFTYSPFGGSIGPAFGGWAAVVRATADATAATRSGGRTRERRIAAPEVDGEGGSGRLLESLPHQNKFHNRPNSAAKVATSPGSPVSTMFS